MPPGRRSASRRSEKSGTTGSTTDSNSGRHHKSCCLTKTRFRGSCRAGNVDKETKVLALSGSLLRGRPQPATFTVVRLACAAKHSVRSENNELGKIVVEVTGNTDDANEAVAALLQFVPQPIDLKRCQRHIVNSVGLHVRTNVNELLCVASQVMTKEERSKALFKWCLDRHTTEACEFRRHRWQRPNPRLCSAC